MSSSVHSVAVCALLLLTSGLGSGCGRPRPPAIASTVKQASAEAGAGSQARSAPIAAAQNSEYVATNKADPHCTDCQKGDAVSGPLYYGKPDMPLDEKTLAEVTDSIDGTSSILEDGLAILEKHVKDPNKAVAELAAYRQKNVAAIKRTFDKAMEIKARLKGSGYDQDIPAEVRPHFDERMGKIHARLELMRDTYRKHPAVLEGFGAFFPRGP